MVLGKWCVFVRRGGRGGGESDVNKCSQGENYKNVLICGKSCLPDILS